MTTDDSTETSTESGGARPDQPTPELSVIICTLNGEAFIDTALDSLASQTTERPWELVVCDNGSTDRTAEVVSSHPVFRDRGRLVDGSGVAGLSHARNVGVDAAASEFVAFLDDDDQVDSDWIEQIIEALEAHRFVGSRMVYDLNDRSELVGRGGFQSSELSEFFGYSVVNGAGLAIEKSLFERVGGNDESMTTTAEDFDFAIRVQRDTGVTPTLAHGAGYHFRQRSGFRAAFRQGRRYGFGHVVLYRLYGRQSDRPDLAAALRGWWWVISRAPLALAGRHTTPWARSLGIRVGRIQGSVANRRWFP